MGKGICLFPWISRNSKKKRSEDIERARFAVGVPIKDGQKLGAVYRLDDASVRKIFSFLDTKDLLACAGVCKWFRSQVTEALANKITQRGIVESGSGYKYMEAERVVKLFKFVRTGAGHLPRHINLEGTRMNDATVKELLEMYDQDLRIAIIGEEAVLDGAAGPGNAPGKKASRIRGVSGYHDIVVAEIVSRDIAAALSERSAESVDLNADVNDGNAAATATMSTAAGATAADLQIEIIEEDDQAGTSARPPLSPKSPKEKDSAEKDKERERTAKRHGPSAASQQSLIHRRKILPSQVILDNLPNLTWVSLAHVSRYVGDNLRVLRCKNMAKINDMAVHLIAEASPRLEEIDLHGCNRITDNALLDLIRLCGRSLTSINVCGCSRLTNYSMIELSMCPNLRHLNLSGCSSIDDTGAGAIPLLTELETLNLGFATRVRDPQLMGRIMALRNLRSLVLTNMHFELPQAIRFMSLVANDARRAAQAMGTALIIGSRAVRRIDSTLNPSGSSPAAAATAALLERPMTSLSLQGMSMQGMTSEDFAAILRAYPRLERLDLSNCNGTSGEALCMAVESVRNEIPHLRIIDVTGMVTWTVAAARIAAAAPMVKLIAL